VLLPQGESNVTHHSLPFQNAILQRLSPDEVEKLGRLERVSLELRHSLEAANTPNEFAYFIEDGVASVVFAESPEHATEIGLIGPEGMSGIGLAYGDDRSPFETFMQVEGRGIRCEAEKLHQLWNESSNLRTCVQRYARAFSIQVSCTAVVNGRLKLEERLARWFLMLSDRVGMSFHVTHEFVAVMLAVRRPGVTLAIQTLEGRGLIRATRGRIQVLDRDGLVALAGEGYGLPEREYARLWKKTT
jgi:CRP-like cAMP-binding protein